MLHVTIANLFADLTEMNESLANTETKSNS